jgi:hypothetical protein
MKTLHYEEYDTTAIVTAHLEEGGDTVYIEMGGILGHVRAITSAMPLMAHRKQDSGITLDGDHIHLARHGHYRVFTIKAPERKAHGITTRAILVHEQFTGLAVPDGSFYVLLPPDYDFTQPPPNFFERFRLAVDVPVSADWQEWLWQKGRETPYGYGKSLVTIKQGYNVSMAQVYTAAAHWVKLIREHLDLKCVLRPTSTGYISDSGEWELRKGGYDQFSIFHNGEQVMIEKRQGDKLEVVPFVAHLDVALKHAENALGIVLILEQ